ncbi:MAG: TIM barrel protein [Chloroflexi bacterium]|nr:TIM barrel protein [Chloroflexota bacterium]
MKLAIGTGVAFRQPLNEHGSLIYDDPTLLAHHLRWWARQGAQGIVFYDALPGFYRVPTECFRDIKAVLDDLGLEVAAFNTLRKSLLLPALADGDEERLYHCLDVCAVLRPVVVDVNVNVPIPTGLDPLAMAARPIYRGDFAGAETFASVAARLKQFARSCADIGAALSIELHDDGIHDTAANCLRLVELIDEPNVGVNPDLGNWYRVPYEHPDSWREQIVALAPRTNYWEVKNYRRIVVPAAGRAYSWIADLEEGDIDFREAATILWDAGFRGWVCNEGGTGDYIRANLRYLSYLRWVLDEWIPTRGQVE